MKSKTSYVLIALVVLLGLGAASCSAGGQAAAADPIQAVTSSIQEDSTTSQGGSSTSLAGSAVDTIAATTSGDTSISIRKVTTGTGTAMVTYFVADVQLGSGTDLRAALSSGEFGGKVQDTSTIAVAHDAILAINGDYYSARDDGVIIRNGVLYRNVPTRMGLALYEDGTMKVFDEAEISAEELLADGVWNTYSFGPALLDDGIIGDDLDTVEAEANPKHPIQGSQPRSGIGIVAQNHFVFVVVDGRSKGYSKGVTLTEFAQIFEELGCATAYNLDGGGSSTMYYRGEIVNDPLGKDSERSISDILMIGS